jgi:hypothetical protein
LVLAATIGDERGRLGTERIGAIRGDQRLACRVRQHQHDIHTLLLGFHVQE